MYENKTVHAGKPFCHSICNVNYLFCQRRRFKNWNKQTPLGKYVNLKKFQLGALKLRVHQLPRT